MLIYTELVYTQLKLFFTENSQSKKITCLCKPGESYDKTYSESFFEPMLQELEIGDKKKKYCCIECRGSISSKGKKPFTFLADTADDLNRNKSYYWI